MCNAIGNVFRLCIIGGVSFALLMQFLVTFGCNFLETSSGNVGLWYVDDGTGNCVDWPTSGIDSDDEQIIKGASSALTLATIFGFAAGIMILFEWLFCEVCCAGCLEGISFILSWLFGGATYMLYGISLCQNNVDECLWGQDSSFMMTACIAYMICGLVLCCAPQPDPICRKS